MINSTLHCFRFSILTILASPLAAFAQYVDAEESVNDDDVVILSPFVVDATEDRGYVSTNVLSATSLNSLVRDLPVPVEIINEELIEDLQATDMRESLEYSAGVYMSDFENSRGANTPGPTGGNTSGFRDASPSSIGNLNSSIQNTISIRGYAVPNNQRFGFRVGATVPRYGVVLGGSTDTSSISRLEVVRGPQALLYGINVLSGIVNIIPKEPLSEYRFEVTGSVGNLDFERATLDATGPIFKNDFGILAFRIMGATQDEGSETDFRTEERNELTTQLKLTFGKRFHELLLEGRYADLRQTGIGIQYLSDSQPTGQFSSFTWLNEFGERFQFGRDNPDQPVTTIRNETFPSPLVMRPDMSYDFTDRGRNYRISGPDTYFDRKERTFLGLLRMNFSENFNGEFGGYYVEQEQEEFNVDLRSFTGGMGPINPTSDPGTSFGRPNRPNGQQLTWFSNPEVNLGRAIEDFIDDPVYDIGWGVGETFAYPIFPSSSLPKIPTEVPPAQNPTTNPSNYERKFARYIWYSRPTDATTLQLRARLAYTFETTAFGLDAKHLLSGGWQYIEDEIEFYDIGFGGENETSYYSANEINPQNNRLADDPVYFRKSIFDLEPLRYNGENLAILARPNFNRLGDFKAGTSLGGDYHLARSGRKEAKLWYRGLYGLYQGKFANDRLTLIGGLRRDQYQVREREFLVAIDQDRETDVWQGSTNPVTPYFFGDGTGPFIRPVGMPDGFAEKVQADYELLQQRQPHGTIEYNFDDYETFDTRTAGISFRVTDWLSAYYLYSEGVFPNTGQRDGNYQPIDAEQTTNNEIGFKFDVFDGKVSGTISVYQIKRENAVFYWGAAPNPGIWHGGPNGPEDPNFRNRFSPQATRGPNHGYKSSTEALPVAYYVNMDAVVQAFQELGKPLPFDPNSPIQSQALSDYGAREVTSSQIQDSPLSSIWSYWVLADYNTVQAQDPNVDPLRRAFDIAASSQDFPGLPFSYFGAQQAANNNPSVGATGANVTYEEEGTGIDGQFIFSPFKEGNYQIIFSFSHQKREVVGNGLNLVDAADLETGEVFGTPYDLWVVLLGPENFEDPTRASTFNGEGINGLDLSFIPDTSLKLWNKYAFTEGVLKGLELGAGLQYVSSAPTAIPIGGQNLARNAYPTPDTPSRIEADAAISYRFTLWDADWRVSLRIDNLLDDDYDVAYVSYENEFGKIERRRTEVFYAPRRYRLNLAIAF